MPSSWWRLIVATALLAAGSIVAVVWATRGMEPASWAAGIVGLVIAAVATVSSHVRWTSADGYSQRLDIDSLAEDLARYVRIQWIDEAKSRRLFDPEPLPVRWRTRTQPSAEGGVGQVGEFLRDLKEPRLVILGGPGSGKTAMAVMLLLDLIKVRRLVDPVPVLLSITSWNPAVEDFETWLTRGLSQNHPALRRMDATGRTGIQRLLDADRIWPILDGLDELAPRLWPLVIRELNAVREQPVVLTCRTSSYEVSGAESGTLSRATVIELEPLTAAAAMAYLEAATPPARREQWNGLMTKVRQAPNGPVGQAMTNPLTVTLARAIYCNDRAVPAELLDEVRFPDAHQVELHLLDELVPMAYEAKPLKQRLGGPHFRVSNVLRWLTFFAKYLKQQQGTDIAWRMLNNAVSARIYHVGIPVMNFLGVGSGAALYFGYLLGPGFGVALGLCFGLIGGTIAWWTARSARWRPPVIMLLRINGRPVPLDRGPVVGLAWGLPVGLTLMALSTAVFGLSIGIAVGIVVGTMTGMLVGFAAWLRSPASHDVTTALAPSPANWMLPVLIGLSIAVPVTVSIGLRHGPTTGLLVGIAVGTLEALLPVWPRLVVLRAVLAARRLVPWRLATFLEDAHRRGILRRVGAVYQFRHETLQERLATMPRD